MDFPQILSELAFLMKSADPCGYPLDFFEDFIGHKLQIDCGSWPLDFAERTWGADFSNLTTQGIIRKVCTNRRTGKPKFEVYVDATKETYTNLDLDYVLRYSDEVPLQLNHDLKAEYIVRLARLAGMKSATKRPADDNPQLTDCSIDSDTSTFQCSVANITGKNK